MMRQIEKCAPPWMGDFLMSKRYKINTYKVVALKLISQKFGKIIEWVIEDSVRFVHNGSMRLRCFHDTLA